MKVFVAVLDFGDTAQKVSLGETIEKMTGHAVHLGSTGNPVVVFDISKLGEFFVTLATSPETNWIEYTVQFEG